MLDYSLLAALAAVIRTGSFERAARQLHVTPSAVSQRIKLLEERVGTVLVLRGQPCTATPPGRVLCQHAEQVALLESELPVALPGLGPAAPRPTLRIAVNADSLAGWFIPVMAAHPDLLFDLVMDDQDHSADWLRQGEVLAAVTSMARPVAGCDCFALGSLRYVAVASPGFVHRHFPDGVTPDTLAAAPCMTFNRKDGLQAQWLQRVMGRGLEVPTHWLPSSQAFLDAALAGVGWGMNIADVAAPFLADGRLVPLVAGTDLDVPLYWQRSRIASAALAALTTSVRRVAGAHLRAG